jgi:periplasmic protein CpxP/Spy
MKKQFLLMAIAAVIGISSATAQGGFQRRTVEERVKAVHEKMDSAFKPDATKLAKIDEIFTNYYKAADKAREDMMAAGNTDREAMRSKMQEMGTDRDNKLKAVLTEAEMKTWKETIEPSMRPQRGNRGGGGGQ